MTGEVSQGQGKKESSTGSRLRRDFHRSPREKLRQRTSSISSGCSQSTISTKPPVRSEVAATPTPTPDPAPAPPSPSNAASARQQKLLQMMRQRRTRSYGESSRKNTYRHQEEMSIFKTEQNFSALRTFSSGPKPPELPAAASNTSAKSNQYGSSGIVSRHSAGISRVSTSNSRVSPSHHMLDGVSRRLPPSPSTNWAPQIDSIVPLVGSKNERTTFHVRLSIGYMKGLKIERIAKSTRQPSNRHITVGYVELASSGKYTASSQPLLTNVGDCEARIAKILWASAPGGSDISKMRRRLHFSLQLERESLSVARKDQRDDDSFTSMGSFSPEVVKLRIGLKCGDEKLILGTAKLVINGRETVEQKMDLTVQGAPGMTSGSMAKRSMFGKKQPKNGFTNGEHSFSVIPNATLRVKVDVRTSLPGQDGASVWGRDDSSYTTNWTYDTSTPYQLSPINDSLHGMKADPSSFGMMPSYSANNGLIDDLRAATETPGGRDSSLYHPMATLHPRVVHTVPPIPVVSLQKKEDKSYMSGLTVPEAGCNGNWWSRACAAILCGDIEDSKKGCKWMVAKSFSFDTMSHRLSDDIQESWDSTSTDGSSAKAGEDLKGTLIHIQDDLDLPSQKSRQEGSQKTEKLRRQESKEQVETLDVTLETYKDLKDAQETLMRYANKVGKNVDELLDEMDDGQKLDNTKKSNLASARRISRRSKIQNLYKSK